MGELPLAPVDRIIRKAGAERASAEAVKALAEAMEEIATEIAKEAAFSIGKITLSKTISNPCA